MLNAENLQRSTGAETENAASWPCLIFWAAAAKAQKNSRTAGSRVPQAPGPRVAVASRRTCG